MSEVREVVRVDVMVGLCQAGVIAFGVLVRLPSRSHLLRLHRFRCQSPHLMTHLFLECRATRRKTFEAFHMALA